MDINKEVAHNGIVKEIQQQGIKVNIVVVAGCVSCELKSACNMSERSDKEVDIKCNPKQFKVGQEVVVSMKSSQGFNAAFLGYVLPFIIMVGVLIIFSIFSKNELIIGVGSIASLIPYYLTLYVFRKQIGNKFSFHANPLI
jgi:sigma-E factor negative regulatory protein RseC